MVFQSVLYWNHFYFEIYQTFLSPTPSASPPPVTHPRRAFRFEFPFKYSLSSPIIPGGLSPYHPTHVGLTCGGLRAVKIEFSSWYAVPLPRSAQGDSPSPVRAQRSIDHRLGDHGAFLERTPRVVGEPLPRVWQACLTASGGFHPGTGRSPLPSSRGGKLCEKFES